MCCRPAAKSRTAGCNNSQPQDANERTGCTCPAARAMHPKTTRQQNAPQNGNQQATSPRKLHGSHRAQTRASMTTEYQDRFHPPHCHMAIISTSTQKNPYHALKGMNSDMTTFRSFYVTHKWKKHPPKAPQPPLPPKDHRRCSSAPHKPVCAVAKQVVSKVEDYTSVYRNDFQAWKTTKRQPFKLNESLKVNQGLLVTKSTNPPKEDDSQKKSVQDAANAKTGREVREPQPFESITSYRSDYVTHPLPPRTRREKPAYQTNKGLPLEHAVPSRPKAAWDMNQELLDEASQFFQQFKTWSLETKFHGQRKAKESSPPADQRKFLSTTHADYTAHKCQHTKPILPSMHTSEKSKEPFQGMTTMKEDYKAWDTQRRIPTVPKEGMDWLKKNTVSGGTPKPAENCKTNPKPCSLHPKWSKAGVCNSSCSASQKPQCRAENGTLSDFECFSTGTEEAKRYWTTFLDRGVTWPNDESCEEPSEAHHIISCMVSSRN